MTDEEEAVRRNEGGEFYASKTKRYRLLECDG